MVVKIEVRYGQREASFELPKSRLSGSFRGPQAGPPIDLADGVSRALGSPLDAPPLSQALVGGDRICIVLDGGLPHPRAYVDPLVECLGAMGIAPPEIQVLQTACEDASNSSADVPWPTHPALLTHDPNDPATHAYLASTHQGHRVYLNRVAVDSDAIVVVGRTGFDSTVGFSGTSSYLYPAASNSEALERSRRLALEARLSSERLRQRQMCDEVGRLVGLFYGLGVSRDRDGAVDALWFGRFQSVQHAAEAHARAHWGLEPPTPRPELVVAAVSRSGRPARWSAVGSALETASRLVAPRGGIVVLSDLEEPPGTAVGWLATDDAWGVVARLSQSSEADALPAAQCARAIASHPIYLLCGLEGDIVESHAMVALDSVREVQKLIDRSASCYIVEDADRTWVEASSG